MAKTGRTDSAAILPALAVGAVAWEAAGRLAEFRFLPPFSRVLAADLDLLRSGKLVGPLAGSLAGLAAGYAMAVVLGLAVGLLMGRYRTVEFVVGPYLEALLATPKIALVPLFYAIFGLSQWIQVAIIFLSAFFVIAFNTMRGVESVDETYVAMARGFGATERQLFTRVLLPAALPLTLAGLRLGVGHAVRGMVVAEMFVTVFGLGGLLRTYGGRFDAEHVYAVLLVVMAVALGCTWVLSALERRLGYWVDAGA